MGKAIGLFIEEEVNKLKPEIMRLGKPAGRCYYTVKFGVLHSDDTCASQFTALDLTLRAAKNRKVVSYRGSLLVQGVDDDVDITLRVVLETVM